MKKVLSLALVLALCLSLAACFGPDRQPAIDAFNEAKDAFNEVANIINANPEAYDAEVITTMNEMASVLEMHKAALEGTDELTQEKLDEMIAWYDSVIEWANALKLDMER